MIKSAIRNLLLITFVVFTFLTCGMFEIDNYEGPNATLNGGIKDAVTGELVETDIQNGSTLKFKELGEVGKEWAPGGILTRVVMQNGEYQDKMMFAGRYRLEFSECNFYPFIVDEMRIEKGENTRDFQVTPYIRVKNVNIRREGDQIVATFNLQAGKPEVNLSNVQLYTHTDIYVGDQVTTFALTGTNFRQTFNPAIAIDESVTYTLTIDLLTKENKSYFKYKKNYYFRVGAMATGATRPDGTSVGTIRRNYAPYTVINFSVPQ